jgi:hypothetical protein
MSVRNTHATRPNSATQKRTAVKWMGQARVEANADKPANATEDESATRDAKMRLQWGALMEVNGVRDAFKEVCLIRTMHSSGPTAPYWWSATARWSCSVCEPRPNGWDAVISDNRPTSAPPMLADDGSSTPEESLLRRRKRVWMKSLRMCTGRFVCKTALSRMRRNHRCFGSKSWEGEGFHGKYQKSGGLTYRTPKMSVLKFEFYRDLPFQKNLWQQCKDRKKLTRCSR